MDTTEHTEKPCGKLQGCSPSEQPRRAPAQHLPVSRKLQQVQEDSPGPDAIAELLDVPVEMVQDTLSRSREARSLDSPLQSDAEFSLMQMIVDEN